MKGISIIIPYLSSSLSIELCKEYALKNADNPSDVEFVEIVDSTGVYAAYNEGAEKATRDLLVFIGDDMLLGPSWDTHFYDHVQPRTIGTCYVIEPGVPSKGVNFRNVEQNFGYNPEGLHRESLDGFMEKYTPALESLPGFEGHGWYQPLACLKESWVPYLTDPEFPHPQDIELFSRLNESKYYFVRVPAFTYHFQCLTIEPDIRY
jgi:hypothetical protein